MRFKFACSLTFRGRYGFICAKCFNPHVSRWRFYFPDNFLCLPPGMLQFMQLLLLACLVWLGLILVQSFSLPLPELLRFFTIFFLADCFSIYDFAFYISVTIVLIKSLYLAC